MNHMIMKLQGTASCAIIYGIMYMYLTFVSAYNIEVKKVGIARGDPGTQFGYSVAIVNKPGWADPREFNQQFHEKVLLIGTPNRTVNNIPGYGGLVRCNSPRDQNISLSCSSMDMTEKAKICRNLKGDPKLNRSDCERDQRMGATIAINKQFKNFVYSTSTLPMVTVCGPGWRNVIRESEENRNHMVGICLKMRNDLKVMQCGRPFYESCWPFWTRSGLAFHKGQPLLAYAQGGLAAAYSPDGRSEVVGGPGVNIWRGAYKFIQGDGEYIVGHDWSGTLYCGYSIATAQFHDKGSYVVLGCPNFHSDRQGHTGKVDIFEGSETAIAPRIRDFMEFGISKSCRGIVTIQIESTDLQRNQVGTKFGAVVYTVDITGDGSEEIFVGAPYYSGKFVEEGRVFVYTMQDKVNSRDNQYHTANNTKESIVTVCGPVAILSGGANDPMYKNYVEFSRFGTSVTSTGDLNMDEINDVAIGAPYEDNGGGAVYIYHGHGSCDCIMDDKFSQRISGKGVVTGLHGFGWSLYGGEDVDDNRYPDLLVGAYVSDAVVMLRTRLIVKISGSFTFTPNPIPLLPESLRCSRGGMLCFILKVKLYLEGPTRSSTDIKETAISWKLDADTLFKAGEGSVNRVVFRNNSQGTLNENFTITTDSPNTRTYILNVLKYKNKAEPRDAWKKVRIEGRYKLIENDTDEFNMLDPVLHEDSEELITADIEFDIKCESDEKCSSDLDTSVDMRLIGGRVGSNAVKVTEDTQIYMDLADIIQIETEITNLVNFSYRTNFSQKVNADLKWHRSSAGIIGATCKSGKSSDVTLFNCSADSIKIRQNENFKVSAHFDISRASLLTGNDINTMKEFIDIRVQAFQAYEDINPDNNVFERRIPVRLKYEVEIYENVSVSDQFRYKRDPNSIRVFNLQHIYYIQNNGPSFLPKTYVNISVPILKGDMVIARIKDYPSHICSVPGQERQIQTSRTTAVTMSTTTTYTIALPDSNRKKRDADNTSMEEEEVKPGKSSTRSVISCTNPMYQCQIIECRIEDFETSDRPEIEIEIEVNEKVLVQEEGKLEVHYTTEAKVTDPVIWFVGKVVPWDEPVSAKKVTVFVVEPATLVEEINIWIIIGSVAGAVFLLVLVICLLWKCGFFTRKKHQEVQKWKQESLYKRKSRMSTQIINDPPYTPIESKKDEK